MVLVSAAGMVFWITSGIDAGWFALQRLELPVGLRAIVLAMMLMGGGWLIVKHILQPAFRGIPDTDLAILAERRFPQFQDRLITAVESEVGYPDSGPLVSGMLQRAIDQAEDLAKSVDVTSVFDSRPLKLRSVVAGTLFLSIVTYGFLAPGSLSRWWSAFVNCEESYHVRTTDLVFHVIAQPGDRRLEFTEKEHALVYLHARGSDFELEMTVPEGIAENQKPWVVPQRARVDVIRADGSRSRTFVSPSGERTFRFILTRLQENVQIEVLAGDFRTRTAMQIEIVSPPGVDSILLNCDFPDYTGWNQLRERSVAVLGSETSLPVGTTFTLVATTNKPLQSVQIVSDVFEILGDRESCRLILPDGGDSQMSSRAPLLSEDGFTFSARFLLTLQQRVDESGAVDRSPSAQGSDTSPHTAGIGLQADSSDTVFSISSNTSLKFFLHDEDGVISTAPETLRIRGTPDEPPVVATRIKGVGNAITRRAVIPMSGTIRDDYGLASAQYEFVVDDETQWRPRPLRNVVTAGVTGLLLDSADRQEQFDVLPLELTEGQTLALAVMATDGSTLPEPNVTRGEPVLFRIVSNEELLALLYTREINLRQRFEKVIQELQQVRDDLTFHQAVAARIESADADDVKSEDRIALSTCATRSGNNLRRQNNELQSIVEGFEEVIEQLINNAIPPQQLAENMRADIVAPLQKVTQNSLVTADRAVSRFRVAGTSGQPAAELAAESAQEVSNVIRELGRILENVRDMAEFHEALRDLKDILEEQKRLQKETNRLKLENLLK